MDVSNSPNMVSQLQPDPLCGGCPPAGSVPQPNTLWPAQTTGAAFPSWPGPSTQLTQAQAPCWTGQPGVAPCWTTSQQVPATVPSPMTMPASAPSPAPVVMQAPPMFPAPAVVQAPPVVPAPTVVQAPPQSVVQTPTQVQPCATQTCWPTTQYQPTTQFQPTTQYQPTPQYQPTTQYQPTSTPVPTPVLAPAPVTAPSAGMRPSIWPLHGGWPYNPGQSGWPGQSPNILPPHWLPPTSGPLSVPYNLNLARGVYDKMMMTILGQVKPNAKMFTVNFLKGNDIVFHINPRFSEGGKQVVVRNHKLGERWGPEERDLKGQFPFAQGSPFEMKILCTHESFRVAVNNIPLFEFRHRIQELNRIDRINILHDVTLNYVNVETLP